MRIALRPSGGRGDYELAGSYNNLHASDLLEKRFLFQITPALTIDGKAKAHRLSGKPRIRPEVQLGGRHPYVVMASVLLLPQPRRELNMTSEELPELRVRTYTIAGIDVDVLVNESTEVTFAPKSIWAKSRGGVLRVDFAERMAIITALWSAADITRSDIAALIKQHKAGVIAGDHVRIVKSAAAIQKNYQTENDVVPHVLRDLGLPDASGTAYTGITNSTEGFDSEDDDSYPEESRRDRERKWRRQADRGPGAREFSIRVREAYDYRCFFSGERFPRIPILDSSPVDGAHILPWSSHQLNSVSNGLCLCKLCHWAFDNGLMKLDFDARANEYSLSIPKAVEEAAVRTKFDLLPFLRNSGRIDPSRLPKNPKLWPSANHILELNASWVKSGISD